MKFKHCLVMGWSLLSLTLAGCAVLNKPVQFVDDFIGSTFFPAYSGPKASVIVADFEIKTANITAEMNTDLRNMLVEGLNETNRFQVVSSPKDYPDQGFGLIIAAEVVEFDPLITGGSAGVGGGGSSASGTLGSLLGAVTDKAAITLNIRIVDAASSKVLFSERISGQAVDNGAGHRGLHYDEAGLNERLSAYANVPMGEAIHKCIVGAINYIVQKVPAGYYKGDKNGKTQTQGKT
ncbi:MAG: CsgG/HfaB family protein [Candidatus Omnitrophota bacterium]